MGHFARPAATLIAATALMLSTAGAAHAQSDTVKDKSSDVIRSVDQTDEHGTVLNYGESLTSGVDLRSMRVKHTKKSVSVTVKFSELAEETTVMVSFRLNGSAKVTRMLFNTWDERGQVINPQGTRRCLVPLTTRTGPSGSVKAVIKRSCLGTPKKLKASVTSLSPGAFEENVPFVGDLLSPTALRTPAWTTWLKAS